MLTVKSNIEKPLIDIELCCSESRYSPYDQVNMMDDHTFEQFVMEWTYGCKKNLYDHVINIGGAGDKGRDVIAYYSDGTVDYYQCKHYDQALAPSEYYIELGKLCYYTYMGEYPIPKNYYVIASNNVGPTLQDLIDKPDSLKAELLSHWDSHCQTKITKSKKIELDVAFKNYIEKFNFSIVHSYPISKMVDEHLRTVYGKIRFGGISVTIPPTIKPPKEYMAEEIRYIEELLLAYSEDAGKSFSSTEELKQSNKYSENFIRQRKDYYSAETIRRFVRDTFTNSEQFEVLKGEVYDGIIDTYEENFKNGYERLLSVMKQAALVTTQKSLLTSKLNCVGNSEKKGVCHMLVNDSRLKWVNYNA